MKGKGFLRAFGSVVAAAVMIALLVGPGLQWVSAGGAGDPESGTVVGIKSVTFAPGSSSITTTTYYNDNADSTVYSTQYWHSADVFVTVDITGTNTLTVTPQWSADGTNWVSAKYKAEGWVLPLTHSTTITNSSGVTSTTTSTHTISFSGSTGTRVSEWVTYQVILSADGSDYVAIPLHGNYLRFKTETLTTGLSLTPTIKTVLRNDAGR